MSNHTQSHLIYSLGKAGKANTHSLDYIKGILIRGPFGLLHGLKANTLYILAPFGRAAKAHLLDSWCKVETHKKNYN